MNTPRSLTAASLQRANEISRDVAFTGSIQRISDEDIASGRHSMAPCCDYGADGFPCKQPVRYSMEVVDYLPDGEYLNTEYFCEAHKPTD